MRKIYLEESDFLDSEELYQHKKLNKRERQKQREQKVVEQMYEDGHFGG